MKLLLHCLKLTVLTLGKYPLPLLCLQSLDLVSEAILSWETLSVRSPVLYVAFGFPITWLINALGAALTFAYLNQEPQKRSLRAALIKVRECLRPLVVAEALVGVLVLLGLFIIFPGIYFLAVYLFVPALVLSRPKQSAFNYLAESKQMTRPLLWPLMIFAVVLLGVSVGLSEIEQIALLPFVAKGFLSLVLSATINTFISLTFLEMTEKPQCSPGLPNKLTP